MSTPLTYLDFKYASTTKIFEAEEIKGLNPDQIKEGEQVYRLILEKLEKNEPIDEGLFGAIIGGTAGALVGPAIGRAICSALGIDPKGVLGTLLTSRLVATAMGVALGKSH